jgi:hypothetical protein
MAIRQAIVGLILVCCYSQQLDEKMVQELADAIPDSLNDL